MNALRPSVTEASQDIQKLVEIKLAETTIAVTREVLMAIFSARFVSPQDFVNMQITSKQKALSEMDQRTHQFFFKMLTAINEQLDKAPTSQSAFQTLVSYTQDQSIRKKLVESLALLHVKALIKDLDGIKTTIVNDIIQG